MIVPAEPVKAEAPPAPPREQVRARLAAEGIVISAVAFEPLYEAYQSLWEMIRSMDLTTTEASDVVESEAKEQP